MGPWGRDEGRHAAALNFDRPSRRFLHLAELEGRGVGGGMVMDMLWLVGGGVLSLLLIFFRPTRVIGKGGPWVLVGAVMLVVSMMLLFWSVKDVGQPGDGGDQGEAAGLSGQDVEALVKALGE